MEFLCGQWHSLDIFYHPSSLAWHSLDIFHHPSSLAFILVHFDNFQKFELFVGLSQRITLKVAFREEYMIEHLSVIAH